METNKEIKQLLTAILGRLEEMGADIKGMKAEINGIKVEISDMKADITAIKADIEQLKEGQARIERHLEFLDHKWMEHDKEIFRLKQKQA